MLQFCQLVNLSGQLLHICAVQFNPPETGHVFDGLARKSIFGQVVEGQVQTPDERQDARSGHVARSIQSLEEQNSGLDYFLILTDCDSTRVFLLRQQINENPHFFVDKCFLAEGQIQEQILNNNMTKTP